MVDGTTLLALGGRFYPPRISSQMKINSRPGSGFKINVENLNSLTLNLGPHTTTPLAAVGLSVNNGDFVTVNVSAGANPIPLPTLGGRQGSVTNLRFNVEGWQNNRINLESITLNKVCPELCSTRDPV